MLFSQSFRCLFYFPTWIFISSRMRQSAALFVFSVHTNSDTKEKAGRWVPGGQESAWQDSRCHWSSSARAQADCRGSPLPPPGRDSPGRLLPLHLVSIMLQSVHLCERGWGWEPHLPPPGCPGAAQQLETLQKEGSFEAWLSALWEVEALDMEQKPRARGKYFLFSKTKSTFRVKLELDVGGCGWDILPDKRDERI